jgi:hypothetical protein
LKRDIIDKQGKIKKIILVYLNSKILKDCKKTVAKKTNNYYNVGMKMK